MKKLILLIVLLCAAAAHAQTSKTEWVAIPADPAASGTTTKALCTAAVKKLYGASLTCIERVTTSPAVVAPPPAWSLLGLENDARLAVTAGSTVRYGKGVVWLEKVIAGTSFVCRNEEFGSDPVPGVQKQCELRSGTTATPPPVIGSATVSWSAPTTKADGSPLSGLAGYRVLYGQSSGTYTQSIAVRASPLTVPNLGAGAWFFVVKAIDSAGLESAASAEVSKTI